MVFLTMYIVWKPKERKKREKKAVYSYILIIDHFLPHHFHLLLLLVLIVLLLLLRLHLPLLQLDIPLFGRLRMGAG